LLLKIASFLQNLLKHQMTMS